MTTRARTTFLVCRACGIGWPVGVIDPASLCPVCVDRRFVRYFGWMGRWNAPLRGIVRWLFR